MRYSLRRIKLEQIRYRNLQQNKKNARISKMKSKLRKTYQREINA